MALQELTVTIEGTAPLMMHNGQLADPLNAHAKAIKSATGRNMSDEQHEEKARLEWRGSLYVNTDGMAVLPSHVLEAALVDGAKKQKLGKAFKSGVFIEDDALLQFDKNCKAEDLWGDDRYRDTRGVRVGQSRVMRTRAYFPVWKAEFTTCFYDELINVEHILQAIQQAGKTSGIGGYRPKYGRFVLVEA